MPARPGFERSWHFDQDAITSGASFSGHERNKLYLNEKGVTFEDVSGISGLDADTDGRAFALFDFDRDGWQDIVLVNANAPLVELFRNRIGENPKRTASSHHTLSLRFVGGNQSATADPALSNRDGIGVEVELEVGGKTLRREQRAGEGFAAQNSATMMIGVGTASKVDRLRVRWPSGLSQELRDVEVGQLVTVYEVPEQSPSSEAFVLERPASAREAFAAKRAMELPQRVFPIHERKQPGEGPRLVLYTTMATWCATCQGELPHWAHLRELFSPEELEIRAVPVDNSDTKEMLERYVARHEPAYEMLSGLSAKDVASVNAAVIGELGKDGLPASFLTDETGQILESGWAAPSVSRIRQLLSDREQARAASSLAATVRAADPS